MWLIARAWVHQGDRWKSPNDQGLQGWISVEWKACSRWRRAGQDRMGEEGKTPSRVGIRDHRSWGLPRSDFHDEEFEAIPQNERLGLRVVQIRRKGRHVQGVRRRPRVREH